MNIARTCLLFSLLLLTAGAQAQNAHERYPYGGSQFTTLVADSYHRAGGTTQQFYTWWDTKYRTGGRSLLGWSKAGNLQAGLTAEKAKLAALHDPAQKTARILADCTALHHWVKTALPRFSLTEGYEFSNAVTKGERQCLLQSVLLSGMLQVVGVDAGCVMVYRSISGEESNLGHVVCRVRLPNGRDTLLDASDPVPFVRHLGLLGDVKGQPRYADPVFVGKGALVSGYTLPGSGKTVTASLLRPLTFDYVRSQFDFYRGERTPGGLLAAHPTWEGLSEEARWLTLSTVHCPDNPLSVYMLGRAYWKLDKQAAARRALSQSLVLYADAGKVPQGPREAAQIASVPVRTASVASHVRPASLVKEKAP